MKKKYASMKAARFFTAAVLAAAVLSTALSLAACGNPAGPGPNLNGFRNLAFESDGLMVNTDSVRSGERAGVFRTQGGTGTVTFSFEEGRGVEFLDNEDFEIRGNELYITSGTPLTARGYKIRVRATDGAGTVLSPESPFTVQVYADMGRPSGIAVVAGQRRLYLSWTRATGAKTHEYCYGTTSNFTAPAGGAGVFPANLGTAAEAGSAADGWLAESTQYWVRVRGKNGTALGPWSDAVKADTPTGDPIQAFWYTGKWEHLRDGAVYPQYTDYRYPGATIEVGGGETRTISASTETGAMGWDCGMDPYAYQALPGGAGVRIKYYGPFNGGDEVVYHKRFTREEAQALPVEKRTGTPYGTPSGTPPVVDTWYRAFYFKANQNQPFLLPNGQPAHAGVFIVRSGDGYYCNYYWGLGAVWTEDPEEYISGGTRVPYGENLQVHMGWGAGGMRRVPFIEAKSLFNLDRMYTEIRWFPAHWYRRPAERVVVDHAGGNAASNTAFWANTGYLPKDW
jgi:hypothetical protein